MEDLQCSYLSPTDAALVALYANACVSEWAKLPSLARAFYAAGGTVDELRGCLRHLIVLAGYGPCLAANLTLQKAKLLPRDTPGKVGGPPGDAFELVYTSVAAPVRRKVHGADPVLGEWIRLHLYGDVYSSPGLTLRQKQLLMAARLAQANMAEQLFGHALAGLRFGSSRGELEEAVGLGLATAPGRGTSAAAAVRQEALKTLDMAVAKFEREFREEAGPCPEPTVPDPMSLMIPELWLGGEEGGQSGWEPRPQLESQAAGGGDVPRGGPDPDDDVTFAWEEADPRIDPGTGEWREER